MSNQLIDDSQSFESLFDSYLNIGVPKAGEMRDGHVVSFRNNLVLVDIGAKSEGVIPASELDTLGDDQLEKLAVGSEVRVMVVVPEDPKGNIILSYTKVAEGVDWQKVKELQENKGSATCTIVGHNKGGLLARIGTLRGFLPASQLGSENQLRRRESPDTQLKALVGVEMTIKVLEADREQGRLILSELEAEKESRNARRKEVIASLQIGEVYDGKVINLTDFGAFVDIGGVEGLVHNSELSWKHVKRPSDILSLGQAVKVSILDIDHDRNRITLSMKRLEQNPWEKINDLYQEGQLVEVVITQLTHYGAFARMNDEYRLEGLIHISELSEEHIKSPDEVVKKGQRVTARVIRINPDQKQIGFSLKQVFSDKYMELDLAAGAVSGG